ncbi:hypothetical protein IJT93_09660 [bacterium]|nr:hypothetical protein [bacterium]
MRVTNRLLLGLACSALCFAFAGCSDDDHTYSPTDSTQNFYLSNIPNTQTSTVIVSNGSSGSSASAQIYLTSNEPTGDPLNIKTERADTYARSSAKGAEVIEKTAVKVKTADAKLEFTPNTKYTDMEKGEITDIYVNKDGKNVSVPIMKLTGNTETNGVLVFSQVDAETMESVIDHDAAIEIDQAYAVKNPYNSEGTPIMDSAHEIAGKEFSPGIDGEEKIIVVVLNGEMMDEDQASFVNYNDEYPISEEKYSNQGEIIYLNGSLNDKEKMLQGLAQGIAHLCSFNQKVCRDGEYDGTLEDEVIEEGRSRFVADYSGFSLSGSYTDESGEEPVTLMACNELLLNDVDAYLKAPHTATMLMINSDDPSVSYGQGYLLHRYIADRFGAEAVRRAAVSSLTGRNNLAEYTGLSFDELFSDFTVANSISNLNNTDSIYAYKSIALNETYGLEGDQVTLNRAVPIKMELTKGHLTEAYTVKAWSSNYFSFNYTNTVKNLHIGVAAPTSESILHLALVENSLLKGLYSPSDEEQ